MLRCCEGWVQGGREGAGEMGLGEKSCPLHHPCCAGLIVVHRCRLQELGACADDPPRGGPRLGCWHGRRRPRQQPGLHVRRRLREEQVEARLVCGHLHCGCAAWPKVPPWQCPECGPCRLLRVPFVAPGGLALPSGKRPGHWASGLCSGCASRERCLRRRFHGLSPRSSASASRFGRWGSRRRRPASSGKLVLSGPPAAWARGRRGAAIYLAMWRATIDDGRDNSSQSQRRIAHC